MIVYFLVKKLKAYFKNCERVLYYKCNYNSVNTSSRKKQQKRMSNQ